MPLLGGALKFATPKVAGVPNFTGDPYPVFDIQVFPGPDALAGLEIDADGMVATWA